MRKFLVLFGAFVFVVLSSCGSSINTSDNNVSSTPLRLFVLSTGNWLPFKYVEGEQILTPSTWREDCAVADTKRAIDMIFGISAIQLPSRQYVFVGNASEVIPEIVLSNGVSRWNFRTLAELSSSQKSSDFFGRFHIRDNMNLFRSLHAKEKIYVWRGNEFDMEDIYSSISREIVHRLIEVDNNNFSWLSKETLENTARGVGSCRRRNNGNSPQGGGSGNDPPGGSGGGPVNPNDPPGGDGGNNGGGPINPNDP